MTQAIDQLGIDGPNADEEYRALRRALRRKEGFGLFFVQASPVKGREILVDLRRDLAGKRVVEVSLGREDERLYEQLEVMQEGVNIFWIEGLDQALLGYEDVKRLAGWDEPDLITYSWKDVPLILSHLNLGRERFEQQFDCALVFVVPPFVVKYLLRRAGDFFDWKSGFFEFLGDTDELAQRVIKDANYQVYLKFDQAERTQKILELRDLLDSQNIEVKRQASLLREMGRLFESGKDYEQAVISYEQAIQANPKFDGAWTDKGDALRGLGRHAAAIIAYNQAIRLNPEYAYAYYGLGNAYYDQKRYDEAITAYNQTIRLNPEYTYAYYGLGNACYVQKCYDEAINAYNQAIRLNPEYADAYNNLGIAYSDQNCYDEAIEAYNQAIRLNPELKKAVGNRGETFRLIKRYDEALKNFNRAIELDDKYTWAIASRGQTYQALKRYDEALIDFNRAIELDDKYTWAIASRGQTYQALKRYDEALIDFNRAIELDDKYTWAISKRGEIYFQTNQIEKSIQDFDRAIELNPEAEWHYYLRALAHQKLNQPEAATTDIQQAITIAQAKYEKDPIDYQNTFNLALYHLTAGHPAESDRLYNSSLTAPKEWIQIAIDDLDDFLELFPDRAHAQQVRQQLQGTITTPTL